MLQAGHKNERGAALILVLGIISVMSTMAIFSFDSLTRLISMTTANNGKAQAQQHALAAEQVAIRVTRDVLKQKVNLRLAARAGENRFVFNDDGARISGEITDITNCFNLTSLVSGRYATGYTANETAIGQFARLLENIGLGREAARAISAAAADWQDRDDEPLAGGAETAFYADVSPPYQTPNAPMASAKELRLIRDVSPKLMQALDGLICADATALRTEINVAMLEPRHAPLLQALLGPTSSETALRNMLAQQPPTGFTLTQFWQQTPVADSRPSQSVKRMFTDESRRVRVKINVETETGRSQMQTDIHFYANRAYAILAREFGAL